MQLKTVVKSFFHKGLQKQYKKRLHKQTISYEDYIVKEEEILNKELEKTEGYDEKSVQTFFYPEFDKTFDLSCVKAKYLLFFPMDGSLSDFAKKAVFAYFEKNPECDFLYGDEDNVKDEHRETPYWKPDWSPSFYADSFYIYGVFAVRKSVIEETDFLRSGNWLRNIVFFCDKILIRLSGFEKRNGEMVKIGHVSEVLFHRAGHIKRDKWQKLTNECEMPKLSKDLVSVVILSKDNYSLVRSNIEILRRNTKSIAYEIILVDNGSSEETRELLNAYCIKNDISYIYEKCDFNFSYLCNLGAERAKGSLLLFMNDDVEADKMDFMENMAKEAKKPYVGAVGCKLLYPETNIIQHAGITNLFMGPMHKLQFEKDNKKLYFGRNRKKINVIAVTAACLMVEKIKFDEVGGFPEELAVAYNDVAFCFALHKAGYYNVSLNDFSLYHHESLTRGCDDSEEKAERLFKEQRKLYEMYPEYAGIDPFYSDRLAKDIANTRMEMKLVANKESWKKKVRPVQFTKNISFEENPANFTTIEWIFEENNGIIISGYSFVQGADNATFEKELWLVGTDRENEPRLIYKAALNDCLRCDVAKNVPEQKNVELSGFCVEFNKKDILPGKYTVWIRQKERFGFLRLFKKTNRSIVVE